MRRTFVEVDVKGTLVLLVKTKPIYNNVAGEADM